MQRLIAIWEKSSYTEHLLVLVLCLALTISIQKRNKYKILNRIPVYIVSLLMVFISGSVSCFATDAKYHPGLFSELAEYIDYSFTIVEMVTFSFFYYQLIGSLIVKKLIIILNIVFCLFCIYMFFMDQGFYQSMSQVIQSEVYAVEAVILLIVCLFFFIEMFTKPPYIDLKNEPIFWISTGLLFFLTCTLPYSLLESHISRNIPSFYPPSYSIFYIFYIFLFLMIIRAYLCKPEKTI